MMPNFKYIVYHTAAHWSKRRESAFDTSKSDLHQWHVIERGWTDIGYNFLVRWDGTIEACRPLTRHGAHVAGMNHMAIGICFSGSGDHEPLTLPQLVAAIGLTKRLQEQYTIPTKNVIGHKEVNDLIEDGIVANKWRTSKSCPGKFIDMDQIRSEIDGKAIEEKETVCPCCNQKITL